MPDPTANPDTPLQSQTHPLLLDRALGSFLGLAVGDALGATVEFMTAGEIAALHGIHREIVGGGWLHLKPGHVTDDTEMALALGSALVSSQKWNIKAVADAFVHWMRNRPTDIGGTCRRGITHYLATGHLSVSRFEGDGGNGAAMRNLPTVLASLHNETLLVERSIEQAHITHNHLLSDTGTVALARMTRRLILEGAEAACDRIANDLITRFSVFRYSPWPGNTSGYIVDTIQTVFDGFFNTGTFEDCLVRVVNRGGDADTTGALAGQLAGALYGAQAIPSRWLKKLTPEISRTIHTQTRQLLELSSAMA